MPNANYLNPTAINPSFPQQPGGALSGYLGYQDRQHFQDVIGLQKLMQVMEAIKQEEELTQGFGARQSERGASTAKNSLAQLMDTQRQASPDFLSSSLAGQIGTNQSLAAKGDIDRLTVNDKVMESRLGSQGHAIEFLNRAIPQLKAAGDTPLAAQTYMQVLQQMPQSVRGMFPQEYGPTSVPMLEALQKQLMNSPKHQADMEKTNAEIAGREKVGAANNAATLGAARIGANSREEVARLRQDHQNTKQSFQNYITEFAKQQVKEGKWTVEQANSYIYQTMINNRIAGTPEDPTRFQREFVSPNSPPAARVPPPEPSVVPSVVTNVTSNEATQAFGNYDPQEWEYFRDPQNPRRIGRKKKGR